MTKINSLLGKLRSLSRSNRRNIASQKPERERDLAKQLRQAQNRLHEKEKQLAAMQTRSLTEDSGNGLKPDRLVWVFGTGRSGSTWLASMMEDLEGHAVWHEPLVGELFGYLYYVRGAERHRKSPHFILGSHRMTWLKSVRSFVLEGATARFPEIAENGFLGVKEPNGSIGAPLLMEALPESRMILLIRDPRDVVASALDARIGGGWATKNRVGSNDGKLAEGNPQAFAKWRAERYMQSMGNSKRAYDAHSGPKTLVRYEDLLADTLGTMNRIYSELKIEVDDKDLAQTVEKHSWERIPEEKKGEGKFYRKAKPGGWREDLTGQQVEIVEQITAPLLEEFYPRREETLPEGRVDRG